MDGAGVVAPGGGVRFPNRMGHTYSLVMRHDFSLFHLHFHEAGTQRFQVLP